MRKWLNKFGTDILSIGLFFLMMGLFREYVTKEPILTASEMWQSGLVWFVFGFIVIVFTTTKES